MEINQNQSGFYEKLDVNSASHYLPEFETFHVEFELCKNRKCENCRNSPVSVYHSWKDMGHLNGFQFLVIESQNTNNCIEIEL